MDLLEDIVSGISETGWGHDAFGDERLVGSCRRESSTAPGRTKEAQWPLKGSHLSCDIPCWLIQDSCYVLPFIPCRYTGSKDAILYAARG